MEGETQTQVSMTAMLRTETRETEDFHPAGRLVTALGVFLFGGLLCLIDINVKTASMIIDIVPDVIGYAMIVWALAVLARVRLGPAYSGPIAFTQVVAVLGLLHSIAAIGVINASPAWNVMTAGLAVVQGFAGVAFCGAMMVLAQSGGATRSYASFRSARGLIGLFIAGPLLVTFVWGLASGRMETQLTTPYQLGSLVGWFVILAIAVGALTLLQFFISVLRLQRELKALARSIE